ncbi:unnamed protein product [Rhizoctonia solani]|uniref:Uncharacterized protein n=1 Tax=Rhizoctonia solani TaxID=456999 RepID=A0A8H3A034_9AGAM|nr:unnamed protein product [Rhizoctonia solani]
MFFRKVFAVATVLASFALSSYAKPIHHGRTGLTVPASTPTINAEVFINNLKIFKKDTDVCSEDISKAASTGKDPEAGMKSLNDLFMKVQFSSIKLTTEQEKECSAVVSVALTKAIKACHDVAANHKFMKYYAKWTETDFAMHSFMQKLAGVSFAAYKESLIGAGKASAVRLHDMKMRHMVNDFRGMGISYE